MAANTQSVMRNDSPTEQPWEDLIHPVELAGVLRADCDSKVLLIDCRSFLEFNKCNIVNSFNVCCSKIVKRRLQQNKIKILDFLSSTCQHGQIDPSYTVILYDHNTFEPVQLASDDIIHIIAKQCRPIFSSVRLLSGGFLEFQQSHPNLLESKTKTPSNPSLSQPCMPVTNIGPTKILPYLFLGSKKDALSPDVAKANGITYVLNVSMTCPKPSYVQDGQFHRIPVNDNYSEKLLPYFHEAFQFIDKVREANGCVLVHCLAGISRSPTLAIAYMMRTYKMGSEEAYRYVKEKRITISPNFNFLGQLLEYEKQIEREGNSLLAGSKRKCTDDLSAVSQSPTTSLTRLRFNLQPNSSGSQSPTAAFSQLRFGAISEIPATPVSTTSCIATDEVDFMPCFTAADTSPRSLNLQAVNSNCNNNNSAASPEQRPPRPGSLSLTGLEHLSRPTSLQLEGADVADRMTSQTGEMTVLITQTTPKALRPVESSQPIFKLPSDDPAMKESSQSRPRPKSMALGNPKEPRSSPSTPTSSTAHNLSLSCEESQRRSRSVEDMMTCDLSESVARTGSSLSSTGSHNSLHGSLEIIVS